MLRLIRSTATRVPRSRPIASRPPDHRRCSRPCEDVLRLPRHRPIHHRRGGRPATASHRRDARSAATNVATTPRRRTKGITIPIWRRRQRTRRPSNHNPTSRITRLAFHHHLRRPWRARLGHRWRRILRPYHVCHRPTRGPPIRRPRMARRRRSRSHRCLVLLLHRSLRTDSRTSTRTKTTTTRTGTIGCPALRPRLIRPDQRKVHR